MSKSIAFFVVVRYKNPQDTFRGHLMFPMKDGDTVVSKYNCAMRFVFDLMSSRGAPEEFKIERCDV